jgi:hypothetical protein
MINMIHKIDNPGECSRIHRGLTNNINFGRINAMAESDSIKKAEKIKFKFCGVCGRLLPALPTYFNKSRNGRKQTVLYYACKKCQYNNKKMHEKRRPKHYKKYAKDWKAKKRQEYLDSIGETEESLKAKRAKKKKQKSPTQRKTYLKSKSVINPKKIKGKMRPAEVDIFGNKKCRKCGEWKQNNEENYQVRMDYKKPALDRICKRCRATMGQRNRKKRIRADAGMFIELSKYEETRTDPSNPTIGQCRCAYCGRWVNPTYGAVKSRVDSFNNTAFGENRIYCAGDQCREACPTYKQQFYPKGFKVNSSREVDPSLRIMCLERDNWTCQKCGANSPDTILHAHHILSYKRNIMLANDIENVITMCKACHNEIHKMEGCGYHELRCG